MVGARVTGVTVGTVFTSVGDGDGTIVTGCWEGVIEGKVVGAEVGADKGIDDGDSEGSRLRLGPKLGMELGICADFDDPILLPLPPLPPLPPFPPLPLLPLLERFPCGLGERDCDSNVGDGLPLSWNEDFELFLLPLFPLPDVLESKSGAGLGVSGTKLCSHDVDVFLLLSTHALPDFVLSLPKFTDIGSSSTPWSFKKSFIQASMGAVPVLL